MLSLVYSTVPDESRVFLVLASFAESCQVSPDGLAIRCECKPGYYGPRCDSCAAGFYGRPEVPGEERGVLVLVTISVSNFGPSLLANSRILAAVVLVPRAFDFS